jgi:hypothetical protein
MVDEICFRVATNVEGLKKICEQFPKLPEERTIQEWRYKYSDFSLKYTQAKMKQAELMAESIADVHQDTINSAYFDEFGVRHVDSGIVAMNRLIIDSHKWQASKLAPKLYGDKQQVDTTITIRHEDALKELE